MKRIFVHPSRPDRRRKRRGGFTIIELLVATLVLIILSSIVGRLMNACKMLSSQGIAKVRANATATAIADTLRRDLRGVSKSGFLCITNAVDPDGDTRARLIFLSSGRVQSLTLGQAQAGEVLGDGQIVDYGIAENQAFPDDPNREILFRNGWVLRSTESFSALPSVQGDRLYLAWDPMVLSRAEINGIVNYLLNPAQSRTDAMRTPLRTLDDVQNAWRLMASHCYDLRIAWTDGSGNNNQLNWYGLRNDGTWVSKDGGQGWQSYNAASGAMEFSESGRYRALWTHHDPGNWPKAIRFRFKLRDPAMPEDFKNVDYEVICALAG